MQFAAAAARLTAKDRPQVDAAGLWARLTGTEIILDCAAGPAFYLSLVTPGLIRNALGRELARGASAAALKKQACDYDPCCAYAVFFGALTDHTQAGTGLILQADAQPGGIVVRLRLLGFAAAWAEIVAEAATAAVAGGLGGNDRGEITRLTVRNRRIAPWTPGAPPSGPVRLALTTPFRARAAPRDDDDPAQVTVEFGREWGKRLAAVAAWADLSFDPAAAAALSAAWMQAATPQRLVWREAMLNSRGANPVCLSGWEGAFDVTPPCDSTLGPAFACALALAPDLHVGRHIGKGGLGRCRLVSAMR